ncbi:hypothetical protein B4088_0794 [Bacillus cereus]|uniref:Uncharacterized protein n=1 Tax=Bacillus cereus TaxID=1396 RepID=A0A164QIC4_BACCE|nr:hypothetical protein B4088_0794 [Bacillus cereus]
MKMWGIYDEVSIESKDTYKKARTYILRLASLKYKIKY